MDIVIQIDELVVDGTAPDGRVHPVESVVSAALGPRVAGALEPATLTAVARSVTDSLTVLPQPAETTHAGEL